MLRHALASAATFSTCALAHINACDFHPDRVIEKDVVILGGGGSGSFAAVRLREDYNASILVIEKEDRLGGHANTYTDPITKQSINYGVQVYVTNDAADNFFARLHIETAPLAPDFNATTTTVDITNGQILPGYITPSFQDMLPPLQTWLDVCKKYESAMTPGLWDFFAPGTIPEELLLPFGEFARKYGIEAVAPQFAFTANVGVGGFENISTWQIMAFAFGLPTTAAFFNGSVVVPKGVPNTIIYDKVYDLIKDDVMLKSQVIAAERDENGVQLRVQSQDDSSVTVVKAKRLLVSFQPSLHSLASLQLDQQELDFFGTFTPTWLYTSVVKIPFLHANQSVDFISAAAAPDNYLAIRNNPYSFYIGSTPDSAANIFQAVITANYSLSHDDAKALILENVQKLVSAGTVNVSAVYKPEDVEIVAFSDHSSVLWRQSPEVAQAGLVQKGLALQGHRSTWYTGALWTNDYSPDVWAFTDTVLPRLMEGLS